MNPMILTTFDWVPEMPRGFVRDLRVRWALEEAGLPYRVEGVPFKDRSADHYVLRLVDRFEGLAKYPVCRGYVERATSRPAFKKAHVDQMAFFAAAD